MWNIRQGVNNRRKIAKEEVFNELQRQDKEIPNKRGINELVFWRFGALHI